MIVEELITKLQKYPGHYSVRAVLVGIEVDDQCADFVDVTNDITEKIVNLELDGRLS
jgi:hypothetical protein